MKSMVKNSPTFISNEIKPKKREKSGLHVPWCPFSVETHLYFREMTCLKRCFFIKRSEKDQNCKLQFTQADYHQRHSLDLR